MAKIVVMRSRLAVLMAEQYPPLTQKRLAQITNLTATTINQLYQNRFKRVDVETVNKLCRFFKCEVGDLFVMREIEND